MKPAEELKHRVNQFLDDSLSVQGLTVRGNELRQFLAGQIGLDLQEESNKTNVHTKYGKALGPSWAAYCIDDVVRTKKYMLGIMEAVQEAVRREGKTVHILYAGCGPFATLVLPLFSRFAPEEIQITLLEIHPKSHESVTGLIEHFSLEPYIRTAELADASAYKLPSSRVDILIGETMQSGLLREPQVPIMLNLLSQISPPPVLIPQCVKVSIGVLNPDRYRQDLSDDPEAPSCYRLLETVLSFDVSAAAAQTESWKRNPEDVRFPSKNITVPLSLLKEYPFLDLFTEILVFNKHIIKPHQSFLTVPMQIEHLPDQKTDFQLKAAFRLSPYINVQIENSKKDVSEFV
ncbi:MAG: hypothetical protein MI784_01525 [Cytophagales bacterium]|nr:hypothetical protein [Cytophagales bacterium]